MKKLIIVFLSLWLITTARAQNQKISEMATYIGNPSGGWVPVVIAGTNRKVDASYFGFNKIDSIDVKQGSTYDTLWAYKNGNKAFYKLTRAGGSSIPDSLRNATLTDGGVAYRILSKPNDSTAVIKDVDSSRYIKLDSTNLKITPRLDIPALKADGRFKIDSLPNVQITSLTNGQVLKWNSTTGKWENAADNNSGTGSGDTSNLIIIYKGNSGYRILTDRNDSLFSHLMRDSSGIMIHKAGDSAYVIRNRKTHLDSLDNVQISSPSNGQVLKWNSTSSKWENAADDAGVGGSSFFVPGGNTFTQDTSLGSSSNHALLFKTNGIVRSRLLGNGNYLFGNANTDAGYKFQFEDSVFFRKPILMDLAGAGLGTTLRAGITVRTANASASEYAMNLVDNTNQVIFRAANDGSVTLRNVSVWTTTEFRSAGATIKFRPSSLASTTGQLISLQPLNVSTFTSGTARGVYIDGSYAPASGTGVYYGLEIANNFDQSVGGTGITRSLFINPTLNNPFDYRAIEVAAGKSVFKGVATNLQAKTSAYTATNDDYTITGDGTSGAFSITLPTAVNRNGVIYIIKKIDASGNAVTVATTSSQTIDGSTTYALSAQWKYVQVQSNGANWIIIGNN